MCLISGSFPYLNGFSYVGTGLLGSRERARSKTWLPNACAEPKDARTMVARKGLELVRSWIGRSF